MEPLLAAIQHSDLALAIRFSRWGYAAVNTAHVFGIALLVGAILPLDLRLLGFWPGVPRGALLRVLVPVAASGLAVAIVAGLLLFSTRALEYAGLVLFWAKLLLVSTGVVSALSLHLAYGSMLEDASEARLARAGLISMTCWLGALIAGRMIAFVAD